MSTTWILCLDENQALRESLRTALVEDGQTVICSAAPASVLADRGPDQFDAALVDIALNGAETRAPNARALLRCIPCLPVVLVALEANAALALVALRSAAYCYLLKPCGSCLIKIHMAKSMEWQRRLQDMLLRNKAVSQLGFQGAGFAGDQHIMPYGDARREFERRYLKEILALAGGNISQAAKLAQKYRADLYRLMEKHDIRPEDYKQASATLEAESRE